MKNTKLLSAFAWVAVLEGISYILLFANMLIVKRVDPELGASLVYPIGMAHGVLFVLYIILAFQCKMNYNWNFKKLFIYLVLSVVPFGTFWVDRKVNEEKKALSRA